jgi:CHC2 zinc finger
LDVIELLQRFSKVKQTGPGKWQACCPAHEDRSPSLAIKESDGTILVHCFGGCSPEDVCGAVGVEMHDLFPPRRNEWTPGVEKPIKFGAVRFSAIDALRCLAGEGSVVLLLAADMSEGKVLGPAEIDRLATALGRVQAAMDYLGDNEIERLTIL